MRSTHAMCVFIMSPCGPQVFSTLRVSPPTSIFLIWEGRFKRVCTVSFDVGTVDGRGRAEQPRQVRRSHTAALVCVSLLLQDLVQSCLRGMGGGYWRTCATRRSVHWSGYDTTTLDIEVDPQRCRFGSRKSDFALQSLVECRSLEPK